LSDKEAELVKMASPLHDVGKVGIPDAILNKPSKLDDEEWKVMQTHTDKGFELLKDSRREIVSAGALIARDHHEKWD
ncbi:metal-dependent phosphohydrolase, partial [Pseudoalteromonas phenolica]